MCCEPASITRKRARAAGEDAAAQFWARSAKRTLVASGCSLDHGGNDAGSAPCTSDMDVDMVATAAEPLASADDSQADSDVEHLDVARAYQHMRERRSTEGGSNSQALDLVPFNSRPRSLSGPNVMWQQLASNGPAMLMHMGPALREQMLQAAESDKTRALVLGAQPLLPLTRQPTLCIVEQEPDNEEQQSPTAMQCASSGQSLAPAHASTSFLAAQAGHQWPWWAQVVGAHQPHPIATLQQGQSPAATASWEGHQGAQGVHGGTWGCGWGGADHQTQFNGSGLWAQGMPCSTPWGR